MKAGRIFLSVIAGGVYVLQIFLEGTENEKNEKYQVQSVGRQNDVER